MAKPEWGTKRICQSCGARFYDLRRDPPSCPSCGAVVSGKPAARLRRATVAAAAPEKAAPVADEKVLTAAAVEGDIHDGAEEEFDESTETLDSESEDADDLNSEEDNDSLIEDTSELGEDDDDMSEVMEHLNDDDVSDRS